MNRNGTHDLQENTSEDYSIKKSRKNNLISLAVCVLLAFVLWLIIMNADDETPIPDAGTKAYEIGQSETL